MHSSMNVKKKLNFQVTSVPSCITWATDSNNVKIVFTLERAKKAQRGNNVQLYSFFDFQQQY
jgi:hypothetical protein